MNETESSSTVQKRIQRASWLMVVSILLSRVIGFFREWILAHTVGANRDTDVYLASFTIPDFLNYLMAAGALSISFIPILSQYVARGDDVMGDRVFRAVVTWFGSVLLFLIVLAEVFAEPLSQIVAPGFDAEQGRLLCLLLRIILPAQFFFFIGGLMTAVQQTHGRFLFPALSPILYNAGIIAFGVGFHRQLGVAGFSIGVLAGSIVGHGILQWFGVRALGYSLIPSWDLSPEIKTALKRYLWLTLPLACGFSLVVTDEWISKYFASSLEARALSWLSYARTEMRIPVAVIGQAAGIASFPYLARLWSGGKRDDYAHTLLRELMKLWAAAPVAAVVMFFHARPITELIYGGSRFRPEDIANTATALQMLSFGLFFWTAQVLISRAFYACQITWLPSLLGGVVTLFTLPLYARLGEQYGFIGLAASGSIGIGVYTSLLWLMLRRHLRKNAPAVSMRSFYTFCLLWTVVLIVCGAYAQWIVEFEIYQGDKLSALIELAISGAGIAILTIGLLRTVFKKMTGGALY